MDPTLRVLSEKIGAVLHRQGMMLACAESCTGGWVSEAITATAGSSNWFDRGFITYSNMAKQEMLDVPRDLLSHHGAVSETVVLAMARGALAHSNAQISLAISGIAGPGGGSRDKPVGTICFAWCGANEPDRSETCQFCGTREQVRYQAVMHALNGLLRQLERP